MLIFTELGRSEAFSLFNVLTTNSVNFDFFFVVLALSFVSPVDLLTVKYA